MIIVYFYTFTCENGPILSIVIWNSVLEQQLRGKDNLTQGQKPPWKCQHRHSIIYIILFGVFHSFR